MCERPTVPRALHFAKWRRWLVRGRSGGDRATGEPGRVPAHEHACDGGDRDKYVPNSKPYIRRPRPIADADPVFTVTHGCRTVLPVELMALAGDGRVRMLTQTYPLDAANDAMDDLDSGRLRGRGILTPTTR